MTKDTLGEHTETAFKKLGYSTGVKLILGQGSLTA